MPKAWTAKDERKYEAILTSCVYTRGKRAEKTCKRIAAATVNRDRRASLGKSATIRGLGELSYDRGQPCGLPYERFRTRLTFKDGSTWLSYQRDEHGEARKGRPGQRRVARALAKAKRELFEEYQQACESVRIASPLRSDCAIEAPVCSPRTKPCGRACIPKRNTCRKPEPFPACSSEEAWGRFADEDASSGVRTRGGDAWEPEVELLDDGAFDFDFAGLGAPASLEIRERETGGKNTFHFEAWLGESRVGEIYASKSRLGGHVVYAVRSVDVPFAHRRKGIATKLYEAAAQEACRRRARLASVERTTSAHSHTFWVKQLEKGRAQVVGRDKTPKYVLDCAFARDLSGVKRRKR